MQIQPLPYHCPGHRLDSLKPPCAAKWTEIETLKHKGVVFLGALEKCVGCDGSKLETRDMENLQRVEKGFCEKHPGEDRVVLGNGKGLPGGKVPAACWSCAHGVPSANAQDPGSEKEKETMVMAEADGNKRMGILEALDRVIKKTGEAMVTRRALAEELNVTVPTLRNWLKPLEEGGDIVVTPGDGPTAPALIALAGPKNKGEAAAPVETPEFPKAPKALEKVEVQEAIIPEVPPPSLPVRPVSRLCKECGEEPEKIDSLNRPMGVCGKCLAKRGKKNLELGSQHGWQPFNIPLNDPKYAEIKEWLKKIAEEYEQDLPKAVMYCLKLSHRQAGGE